MKFDLVVGNPPYNVSNKTENVIVGTSGDVTLYKRFVDRFFALSKGTVAMVVQRNGIRYAKKKHYVTKYNMDTSSFWKFNAGFFISENGDDSCINLTEDIIMQKVYNLADQWKFSTAIGGSFSSNLNKDIFLEELPGTTFGLIDIPNSTNKVPKFGWIKGKPRTGVQLLFKGLESSHGYFVTDQPSKVGSTAAIYFDTLEEANAAKLFIQNNPVIKYLQDKTKEKALGFVFRSCKRFDLSQIKTGYEIPVEWNLTKDEIAHVESNN